MRSERGQTAAEYLGVLLVISVIVAAVAQTALGHQISGQMTRLVCVISGSGDCSAQAQPPAKTPPGTGGPTAHASGGPTSGPPIAGGPRNFPVLPFPGSVSVTCTGSLNEEAETCQKGKGTVDGGIRVKGTVTRGVNKLNPSGCPVTTLSLSTALEAYGSATVGGEKAKGGVELYGGKSTNYDVTVTPDRADAIGDGTADAPNPLDPRTLKTGEGIEMSDKYYAGLNLSAQYKALQATMGFEKGRKLSTGVRRINDSTVRIYVGDSDYVKNALTLGLNGDVAKIYLGNDTTFSNGKMRAIDVDVSTPAGWAAYQAFAKSGTLPKSGAGGTTNPTSSDTVNITSVSKLGAAIGGLDASVTLGDSEGNLTETHNADGTTTRFVDSRYRNVGLQVIKTTDAHGNVVGPSTYALNFKGVDPHVVQEYQAVNGLPQTPVKDGNLRLQYTPQDLTTIQNQAIDHIRAMFAQDRTSVPSRDDIRKQMSGNPYAAVKNSDGVEIAPPPLESRLASAKTPEDVLVGLYDTGLGNASSAVDGLAQFALKTDLDDGKITHGPLKPGDRLPGAPVTPDCA